jgi:hypothetical protein
MYKQNEMSIYLENKNKEEESMKKALCISICMMILMAFAMWAPNVDAYPRYYDDAETPGSNCSQCHGAFTSDVSPKGTVFLSGSKHEMHRSSAAMNTTCNYCHTNGDSRNPYMGSSNDGLLCGPWSRPSPAPHE